ncbi:hypothetical protein [Intestinibacter bartlettii]|uniref:hypothetical protein n=1 Tax=Intestinibacter bartlettii TaxID=261299 RepID=UPI0008221B6D|nr:hypothetical protein [Intestinibacter bartlettii]SCI71243.1 Uncharacterised protein [uncultured Clostridium sp.]
MEKKLKSKRVYLLIILIITILIAIPFVLGVLIPKESLIPNLSQSNDWIGFWGSYTGGILGGLCTLTVMYFTRKDTRYIQEQNRKLEEIKEKKEFCNEIAEHISIYLTDISSYFFAQYLNRINENVPQNENHHLSQNRNNNLPQINRSKAINMYFLLRIKLNNISEATGILAELDNIHNQYCFLDEDDDRFQRLQQFQNHLNLLEERTREFINNYSSLNIKN